MPKTERVVIIIPTYNEKPNVSRLIPHLIEEVFTQLPASFDPHILIVDDSSPDGTADAVRELSQKYTAVHLLVNKKKGGLGKAYMSGMRHALQALKADIVFEFDADFSHDPSRIPVMLSKLVEGHDLVLGSRYIPGGSIPDNWGWHRKFLSVLGNRVIQLIITDFSIKDWTTGYRAIRKQVLDTVLPYLEQDRFNGYTFQIGFLHKAVREGFSIAEVPIHFVDRTEGVSKLGVEYIKNTLLFILKVRLQEIVNHRVFKFGIVGVIGAIVQFASRMLYEQFLPFQLAFFLSVEMAVISNFIFSNLWTFADRKLSLGQIPAKFLQFNLASGGAIIIQQVIALIGEFTLGIRPLFTLPLVGFSVSTADILTVTGIFVAMFWNFFAYNRYIWQDRS